MRVSRAAIVVLLILSFGVAPSGPSAVPAPPEPSPTREIRAESVTITVPATWRARTVAGGHGARGIQAARNLRRWNTAGRRDPGLEAYWIDAAAVGVPSDYYYLAAEGPALTRTPGGRGCRRYQHEVLRDRRPRLDRTADSPGDYVATAGGACGSRKRAAVWASFVAAPGFGPVGTMGIPESGLYFALVVVPDGPRAHRRAERLLSGVRFGDARVGDLIDAARGQV